MSEILSKQNKSEKQGKSEAKPAKAAGGKILAVIRVRGTRGVRRKVAYTLKQLHLTRTNSCILLVPTETSAGMLGKANGYITWGEASDETVSALKKKGDGPYGLSPPLKGFKGGIKKPFPRGALGYRGEKINDLIKSMLR